MGLDLGIVWGFKQRVEFLCPGKLVDESRFLVFKLRDWIKLDGFTYSCLIEGFYNVGDLIEALKILNLMVDEGFEPNVIV